MNLIVYSRCNRSDYFDSVEDLNVISLLAVLFDVWDLVNVELNLSQEVAGLARCAGSTSCKGVLFVIQETADRSIVVDFKNDA